MRPRGWIQDSGSFENLIKVVELFDKNSTTNKLLTNKFIRDKVLNLDCQEYLVKSLLNEDGYKNNPLIEYKALVGSRTNKEEVDGLIQVLIPGQSRLGIVDWACDNFIRLAYTFNYLQYSEKNDSFSITEVGLKLANANNLEEKFEIIKHSLLSYPPVTRILELLNVQYQNSQEPSLTKYEIGRELGFKGEAGFTSYSQKTVVHALSCAESNPERTKIKNNWEGSSDKYARMISKWLCHNQVGWVQTARKKITVQIGEKKFTSQLKSYQITLEGIKIFKLSRAHSRHPGVEKSVGFEMLSTKENARNFLRLRRAYILTSIKNTKNLAQIQDYLKANSMNAVSCETIKDDLDNFARIGLDIAFSNNKYKIRDKIINLEIPQDFTEEDSQPDYIERSKDMLRKYLEKLDHGYLDMLDLGASGRKKSRLFETRIVDLLKADSTHKCN
ncbi:Type-2 restriction enzyme FokI [Limihaloglobus sulfuriphilus]|uniref:Type-2 restriction enzyme FokI n=1 Tax=Limihaloglobus sulfuriphilus TaxID=1851148 RepID=A0A1Q2MCL2_9BACT|nr:restriction endonuclease FokI catalytic domain-containing protein [Limihaloglobus sulfuriphilus]AQQ70389.1 Type-2 restriction enzyme FokI [Limihaloglobus sulfuriphilus]